MALFKLKFTIINNLLLLKLKIMDLELKIKSKFKNQFKKTRIRVYDF